MCSFRNITLQAGPGALTLLREEGLKPERINILAGAAGGPKWLVLSGLDRFLLSGFFRDRSHPLYLIGSSIGAWRFASYAKENPLQALEAFETAYISQRYSLKPSQEEIDGESQKIMDACLSPESARDILSHPFMRLNLMVNRSRRPVASESRPLLAAGIAGAALMNLFSRRAMGLFLQRVLFYDPRDLPPFFPMEGFGIRRVPLAENNLKAAVLASGSIPLVMSGVRDIPGAGPGVYRDGGLIDYHLDIPYGAAPNEIILFPHYTDRMVPGWFDKPWKGRKPAAARASQVLLVSPSREFVAKLPLGKIPDRDDFYLFKGRDDERLDYWHGVLRLNRILAEEFGEAVESGRIKDIVLPLDTAS